MTDNRINSAPLDRFTVLHLLSGAGLAAIAVPLWASAGLSIGFELAENALQPKVASIFPETAPHDTIVNSTADVLALCLGWFLFDVLRSA